MTSGISFNFSQLELNRGTHKDHWERVPPPSLGKVPAKLAVAIRHQLGADTTTQLAEAAQRIKIDDKRDERIERRLVMERAFDKIKMDLGKKRVRRGSRASHIRPQPRYR